MSKDDKKKKKQQKPLHPLDPTRSGEDFVGDTTGMTGITTGKAEKTSRTPDDRAKDENKTHLPGGILENEDQAVKPTPSKSDLSTAGRDRLEDIASEPSDHDREVSFEQLEPPPEDKKDTEANTSQAPYRHPSNQGEQSVSGTTPDPESDDDTLANAQEVGEQLNKDDEEEHPQELDLGSDIDKAEERR